MSAETLLVICGVNELSLVNLAYVWQNNSKDNNITNSSTNTYVLLTTLF